MSTDDRRDLHIHSYLRECAKVNLAQADMDQGNGFYFCMSANIFSAFAIEAALNYIGHHIVSNWEAHERKGLPAKMKFIRKHLELSSDEARRLLHAAQGILTELQRAYNDYVEHHEEDYDDGPPPFMDESLYTSEVEKR